MISEIQQYGNCIGVDNGSTLLLTHPRLSRMYWIGSSQLQAKLPNITYLQQGTPLYFILESGRSEDFELVREKSPTAFTHSDGGGVVIVCVLINSRWSIYEKPLNTASTSGSTTRVDTLSNVKAANARPSIPPAVCEVWALVQCSGPTIGSTLYSRQDFSEYADKFIGFSPSVDPPGVFREVMVAGEIGGPIDTRDLLSAVQYGPLDQCDTDFPDSCPWEDAESGPQTLSLSFSILPGTGVDSSDPANSVATQNQWAENASGNRIPIGTTVNLLFHKTAACQWTNVWRDDISSTLYSMNFNNVVLASNSNLDVTHTITLSGSAWILEVPIGVVEGGGNNPQGLRTRWKKESGGSPTGVYVPVDTGQVLTDGFITVSLW